MSNITRKGKNIGFIMTGKNFRLNKPVNEEQLAAVQQPELPQVVLPENPPEDYIKRHNTMPFIKTPQVYNRTLEEISNDTKKEN